jgi:glutamyl-tRNA reductase
MTAFLDQLCCWSLSVRDGDEASLRERATLDETEQEKLLSEWIVEARRENPEAGLLYLSTCHRVEIYGYGIDPKRLKAHWLEARGVDVSDPRLKQGLTAFRHLVRVTSSLESEVLGETQITGQVKEASDKARQCGFSKGPLDRCVQQALRCAKKIRSATALGEGTVSVAHVAVDGLADVFDTLESKNALVIGAGPMAQQALERLVARGLRNITWINRTASKLEAHPLATQVRIEDYARMHELVWEHAITVAATSSTAPLLTVDPLRAAEKKVAARLGRSAIPVPRVILDLGLPRNVESSVHGHDGFFVRNVDEFKDRAEKNSERRRRALEEADQILELEIDNFIKLWKSWEKGPLMAEIFRGVEALRSHELASRTSSLGLEEDVEIEYIVRNIYAKLMHRVVEEVEALEPSLAHQVLETLVRAWRQPDQWLQRNPQQLRQKLQKQRLK